MCRSRGLFQTARSSSPFTIRSDEHPTSNIQRPTSNQPPRKCAPAIGRWVLDVGCWMFQPAAMIPGEIIVAKEPAELPANLGRETKMLTVANTGDRPIQVGSHFHFFEVNSALR